MSYEPNYWADTAVYVTAKPKRLDRSMIWFRKWLVRAKNDGLTQQGWDKLLATFDSMTDRAAKLEQALGAPSDPR